MTFANSWSAGEGCKVHPGGLIGYSKTKRKAVVPF